MNKININRNAIFELEKYIFLIGLTVVTISIAPWWISDGFNVPKFSFLVILGFTLIPIIFLNKHVLSSARKNKIVLLTIFPIALIMILILNDANKTLQFYGEVGRRTGFLTYFSCYLIFIYTAISKIKSLTRLTLNLFLLLGLVSSLYSILQPLGFLRIYQLESENTKPYSFFGNINFSSGFLGLVSILVISRLLFHSPNYRSKVFNILMLFLFQFSIFQMNSQQGFILSFAGFIFLILIQIYKKGKNLRLFLVSSIIAFFLAFQFILGLFNKGLANTFIWGPSVEARNFYWKAALDMTNSKPLLGMGLDRYGDWYWAYRDLENINALGVNDFSTSAHNIFLDLSSSGGYTLLISYLILIFYVFYIGIQKVKKNNSWEIFALFSTWVGFNIYSLISIGQIGLLIWGWVLGGLIVNWDKDKRTNIVFTPNRKVVNSLIALSFLLGCAVVQPVVQESYQIRKAITIDTKEVYLNYLQNNFIEPNNIALSINKLQQFGLQSESRTILRKSVNTFPDNYNLWETIYLNSNFSKTERADAYQNLLRLNFYNRILAQQP